MPALSANGEFLYVPVLESNMTVGLSVVIVIDTNTNAVVGNPIPVGEAPIKIAVDGKVGYVSNEISGTVTVIKIQ